MINNYARGIDLRPAVAAAAPQVLCDYVQLHGNRLGEALIAQLRRGDQHDTPASEAFDLRVEPMTNQIGDCVDTLHSHERRRTS
ncbi:MULTISPECIES: hypothetical protein [Erythrobacter]|jgi:hypothetical protein|uniref:hypothetical protein n=1 Tax=Erythrobacter TaxID=1041 RepID=UPI000B09EB7A|nr:MULTISPECIES: hypothetical protein [Erythrobacter]